MGWMLHVGEADPRYKLRTVGKIGDLQVWELFLFGSLSEDPKIRCILVGSSPIALHEIDVFADTSSGTLFPAEIIQAGDQGMIKLKYDDGGMYHIVYEDYFLLSRTGAILLDWNPVFEAAERAAPPKRRTYNPASGFNWKTMTYGIGTIRTDLNVSPKMACCEGGVTVPFRIESGKVIAGRGAYQPR